MAHPGRTYAVMGASGHIGKVVSERLLQTGNRLRVIGRGPERLKGLTDRGAIPHMGEFHDAEMLTRAFAGADGVFAMIPPNHQASDHLAYQNQVGAAIARALDKARVRCVVSLSSIGAHLDEKTGPIHGLHDQEVRLNAMKDLTVVHLRPAYFLVQRMRSKVRKQREHMRPNSKKSWRRLIALLVVFAGASPGLGPGARAEGGLEALPDATASPSEPLSGAAGFAGAQADPQLAAVTPSPAPEQTVQGTLKGEPVESEDYDPWEPFNSRTFWFNRQLDRYVIKPVATGWDAVLPDVVQRALGRAFDNLGMPRRFVNSLLQLKLDGAGREPARFLLNSTFGMAGLLDVAREAGIEASDADTGQTLGVYGVGPGPYLVLPFLPPLTVRDGIGMAVDAALNPLNYVAPFAASAGTKASDFINARSRNLQVFEDVEESTLDLYSAVRNGYLQRREKAIQIELPARQPVKGIEGLDTRYTTVQPVKGIEGPDVR